MRMSWVTMGMCVRFAAPSLTFGGAIQRGTRDERHGPNSDQEVGPSGNKAQDPSTTWRPMAHFTEVKEQHTAKQLRRTRLEVRSQ